MIFEKIIMLLILTFEKKLNNNGKHIKQIRAKRSLEAL